MSQEPQRWGSEVHQEKRKKEKITFEAMETDSSNCYSFFFFSLINCTRPTYVLAGPARTLHLPITWYPREVEKTWTACQALLQPSKLSPLWDQPAQCEGVSRVRNRRTEANISSGQSRAPVWPAEGQMRGEAAEGAPGKLALFIPILGILPQPCLNALLPVSGALGKLLWLGAATTKTFPRPPGHPNHTSVVPLPTPWAKERSLSCCSGLTDPQG